MGKTTLTKAMRDSLLSWMMAQLGARLAKEMEKSETKAIETANKVIRIKYPEADMVILRKYKCTHTDTCLRFVNDDSGQVLGVVFSHGERDKGRLADLPSSGGCNRNDVFPVTNAAQKILEAYTSKRDEASNERHQKQSEYFSFLAACKTVEAVDEVLKLPDDIKARYVSQGALVAINPDVIASIKKDFSMAA